MTIQQLYDWAIEEGFAEKEIRIKSPNFDIPLTDKFIEIGDSIFIKLFYVAKQC